MRSLVVVVVGPGLEALVALFGVDPVLCVGPFAQRGLDKALGLAVGSWRIRSCTTVFDLHLLAGESEESGAIAGAVVGEQSADADAVTSEELDRRALYPDRAARMGLRKALDRLRTTRPMPQALDRLPQPPATSW